MLISAFITTTKHKERAELFDQCYKSATGFADEVVVVDGEDTWPKEFDWQIIGQHFQKGYEQAQGQFVVHLDCDFIFHENYYSAIRQACENNPDAPAISFYKWQFILPDRYNLKSRLVIAVNKKKFGDRIIFNSGGDLCQPSLDGKEIKPDDVPEARIPFYNYEKLIKTREQIIDDVSRMDRAYHRHFGEWLYSSDKRTAYRGWLEMASGRFYKPSEHISLDEHPEVMKDIICSLKSNQWGYNGLGNLERNNYVKNP